MTFKDVVIRNFKGNIKKYIVYYLCNSFIIAMFFMYSVLIFNEGLWTTSQIEKGVLEVLVIPNVSLAIFSLFFISYAHSSFIKWRKKEFGIFMNLGMTTGDIRKIIIYENTIVALGSIAFGLLVGLVFSRLFFIVITKLLGVNGVSFILSSNNFLFSVSIFSGIYLANLLTTIVTTYRFEIIKLLKSDRKVQRNKINSPFLALVGLLIVIGSSIILYKKFNDSDSGEIIIIATLSNLLGVYIFISQLGGFLINLFKRSKKLYFNKLLFITNLNSKFKQTKKIIFMMSVLSAVVIFYIGTMLSFYIRAEVDAVNENTYDISYVEINGKNILYNEKIEEIVASNNEKIVSHDVLEFIYYYGTHEYPKDEIIITDKEINKLGKVDLRVNEGCYILLRQFEGISEEVKKEFGRFDLSFSFNSGSYELYNQENIFKEVVKNSNYIYSNINVVNENDYNFIMSQKEGYEVGRLQLYNLDNWRNAKTLVDNLEEQLSLINKEKGELNQPIALGKDILKVSSKIGSYNYNKQSSKLLLLSSGSLGIFFFIATAIVLFLKLLSDVDSDKKRFNSMYKIGITDDEIRKQIKSELKPIFFIGPIIGIILAFIYAIVFGQDSPENVRKYFIYSNIIISAVFLVVQIIYYFICKKIYCGEILS